MQKLSVEEKKVLLELARKSLEYAVVGEKHPEIDPKTYSELLQADGACFVTLTINGQLRGCIGALEARQPLVVDVIEHAAAAATQDFRFPSVEQDEVDLIHIEISRLTKPEKLDYESPADLINHLQPGKDGVILQDGYRRATFLPQVWEKINSPEEFLEHLCVKMGGSPNLWKTKLLDVKLYRVEEFEEE